MKYVFCLLAATMLLFSGCRSKTTTTIPPDLLVTPVPGYDYIGKVNLGSISVRLIILRHTTDGIAHTDAKQVIQAANIGESKGLSISQLGHYHIGPNGQRVQWSEAYDLEGLKAFISEQMKIDRRHGDTFMIYTVGHGGGGGGLATLCQREDLVRIMAESAEENNQETFWWQLSCHAAAKLPLISSLNEKQQKLFSMTASSPSNKVSYFCTQGEQIRALFIAMAEKSPAIDPDQNEIVTAGELRAFLIEKYGRTRGELVFAKNDQEPIFGLRGLADLIPVYDHQHPSMRYDKEYIVYPEGY